MRHRYLLFFLFLISTSFVHAQQTEDAVVAVAASVDMTIPAVELTWELADTTSELLVIRREKDAADWFILLDTANADITGLIDPFVDIGATYEYGVIQTINNIFAFGYVTVPIHATVTDDRGRMLIFVEEALQQPLSMELERLELDLAGDGWKVTWHPVGPGASVTSVKDQIVTDYAADPSAVKSVLLLGEIPVPYSGNTNWDGHNDHQGAWPADTYYGDTDGTWLDVTVNNTTPSRPANDNVPGDGKFDHSIAPTAIELAVGRVDFSNLSEATFGTTRVELMRRYLDKNHRWRTKQYLVDNKAIVDDNFGYFSGEAFAANGYRNFYPIVGKDNVTDGDFFGDSEDQHFLLGYGCGGGSYTSAAGVGNSTNFANKEVNIVFSMLFGSYHGDWDFENNPFMPSALASEGGILSCAWAGRPHWFFHHLAAGETLGYCAIATQNACDNPGYFGSFGDCGAHVSLLGDPTLRAHIVAPVSDLVAVNRCESVILSWNAVATADAEGYLVYRADSLQGDFVRLTPAPVQDTSFTDLMPITGDAYYQVRTVALENTPSGSYYNTSTGVFLQNSFAPGVPPTVSVTTDTLSCDNPQAFLTAETDASQPVYSWTGPGGFSMDGQNITVSIPGNYQVIVTDETTGCSATASATVLQDDSLPEAAPQATGELTCVNTTVQLFANPDAGGYTFQWTGPGGFLSSGENPVVDMPGLYSLVVTASNGCSGSFPAMVNENVTPPQAVATGGTLSCLVTELVLDGSGSSSGATITYGWTTVAGNILTGANTVNPLVDGCAEYVLIVTDLVNGCTASATVVVECDITIPDLSIEGETDLPCFGDQTTLTASSDTPGTVFSWEGPGITDPFDPEQLVGAGIYDVTATGPNGCTGSGTVIVSQGTEITTGVTYSVDCAGATDVIITAAGGDPPYMIVTDPPAPLSPETSYTYTVTDASGCTVIQSATTPPFDPLTVSIDHTDESVSGAGDGTATASPEFGSPPYTYEWSNGAMTDMITDLTPGIYTVTITDANQCTATESVEILEGVSAVEDIAGLRSLTVYPNPSMGSFNVSLEMDHAAWLKAEIVDIHGKVIVSAPPVRSQSKIWQFGLEGHPAGLYLCKVQVNDEIVYKKLIVL